MAIIDGSGADTALDTIDVSPYMATLFFFVVTSIYCALCMFIKDAQTRLIIKVCYILFVVVGEYFINLNLSEGVCGVRQWNNAFFITFVPWTLIFGVLHMFLYIFPGWYRPFSNTFGYLVVKLMGLSDLMKDIVVDPAKVAPDGAKRTAETLRAIESVRSDNSLIVNELFLPGDDKDNTQFNAAVDKLVEAGVFDKTNINLQENNKFVNRDKLYGFILMKNTISEYVWNLMTGFLVTSVTYNFIINSDCQKSTEQMRKSLEKYEADQQAILDNDAIERSKS